MRDDFDQFGMHDCQRCKQQFPEFMFHLSAGYCNDCYDIVQQGMDEDDYNSGNKYQWQDDWDLDEQGELNEEK